MATFKTCVFEHQKREDGKYPISIRVYWRKQLAYIHTAIYVTDNQVVKKSYYNSIGKKKVSFTIKDSFVINEMNSRIVIYENIKLKLGINIDRYSAKDLAEYIVRKSAPEQTPLLIL